MQLHPPGEPLVVPGREVDLVPGRGVRDALPRLPVPDGGVGDPRDPLSRKPPVLGFNAVNLPEHLLRRPLDPLVGGSGAAVQLQNPVGHPVVVHRPPAAGKGPVVAPVEAAVNFPPLGNFERLNDMGEPPVPVVGGVVPEFLKELAVEHIPAALQPGLAQLGRQFFQRAQVFRLAFLQGGVVADLCLDKGVVLRVLVRLKPPVDEQPLEVAVAGAAGVQGVVGALGKVVHAPDAGVDLGQPAFLKLSRLVGKPHVVLRALVLAQIGTAAAIAERDGAAVRESEQLFGLVVPGKPSQDGGEGGNVVVEKLLVGPAGDEDLDAGVAQAQEHRLPPDEPAFPAAPGAAVAHIAVCFRQGPGLLGVGTGHGELTGRSHRSHPPRKPPGPFPPGLAPVPAF